MSDNNDEEYDSDTNTITPDYPRNKKTNALIRAIEERDLINLSLALSFGNYSRPKNRPSLLWMAIHKGTPEIVDIIIRAGYSLTERRRPQEYYEKIIDRYYYDGDENSISDDPKYTYNTRMTLLHWAVINKSYHTVRCLLAHGASLDWLDDRGNSVLQYAVESKNERIAEELIKQGANVNQPQSKPPGNQVIHDAANSSHITMMRMLLANGANAKAINQKDQTPLHVLLMGPLPENSKLAELLISYGCPVDYRQSGEYTPLYLAVKRGLVSVTKVLLANNADPNTTTSSKDSFPLLVACQLRYCGLIQLLLTYAANINQRIEPTGETVLHEMCSLGYQEIVHLLVKSKANINAIDNNGMTPLHIAIEGNNASIARYLLKNRANVEARTNKNRFTPLHLACKMNDVKLAELLIKFKADLGAVDREGHNPLHIVALSQVQRSGDPVVLAERLINAGVSVRQKNFNGFTPLHLACRYDKIALVKLLLKHGADINSASNEKITPLSQAVEYGSMKLIKYLIQERADVNCRLELDETPIYKACVSHHAAKVKLLMDCGAQLNIKSSVGKTPYISLPSKSRHAGAFMLKQLALMFVSGKQIESCDLQIINIHVNTQSYFKIAVNQAKRLKNHCFFQGTTFLDVINLSPYELYQLVKNDKFEKAFVANVNEHYFYKSDLMYRFERAVKRRTLIQATDEVLGPIFSFLPDAIITHLSTYLIADHLRRIDLKEHINSIERSIRTLALPY